MATAFFIPRLGGAFAALAAVFCSVVLPVPEAHAAGWGWGVGIGSNGVTVIPQASVNLTGGYPNDRRGYYEPAPYGYQVPRAIVIVPAQPQYRDPYDDRYWEDEAGPPPRPRHGPGAKRGHGHRHHHHHNGRDYRR